MANLKQDILNNLGNEKYFEELELARLAQDANSVYSEKVEVMANTLKNIASIDLSVQLVGKYFPEAEQAAPAPAPAADQPVAEQPAPEQPAAPAPQPGQTHAE
jgi:hypothetical protein